MAMKRGCKVIPVLLGKADWAFMQKFSCDEIVPWKIKSINELEDICKKQRANAVVVNDSFGNARELLTERVVVRPLSGFSVQEIKNERKHFEMLASNS
jgi:hypothetical protein